MGGIVRGISRTPLLARTGEVFFAFWPSLLSKEGLSTIVNQERWSVLILGDTGVMSMGWEALEWVREIVEMWKA